MISLTVVPFRSAISPNVSPDLTVYRAGAAEELGVTGAGVGGFGGGGGAAGGVPATGGWAENAMGAGGGVPANGPGGGI